MKIALRKSLFFSHPQEVWLLVEQKKINTVPPSLREKVRDHSTGISPSQMSNAAARVKDARQHV